MIDGCTPGVVLGIENDETAMVLSVYVHVDVE